MSFRIYMIGLLALILSNNTLQAQNYSYFEGNLYPDRQLHSRQKIQHGLVLVYDSTRHLIDSCSTDSNGHYRLKIPTNCLLEHLQIETEARHETSYTYDSICPYMIYRTPKGYFDWYQKLKLKDSNHIEDIYLKSPIIDYINSYPIHFKENSDSIIQSEFNVDTTCICLYNIYEKMNAKGYKLHIEINLPFSTNENEQNINTARKVKIEQLLTKHFHNKPPIQYIPFEDTQLSKEYQNTIIIYMVLEKI